jgi:glycerol-3-phosphate acyltransferase PlsY
MRVFIIGLGSYVLGCLNGAYYIVRLRSREDIRGLGSGNAGARNVLRTRGRAEAVATVTWDMAKGALAIVLARVLAPDVSGAAGLALLLVVIGHIWPPQLAFHGGKGAASLGGGLLALAPLPALLSVAIAAVLFLVTRSLTASGLAAFAVVTPVIAAMRAVPDATLALVGAACIIVLVMHHPRVRRGGPARVTTE